MIDPETARYQLVKNYITPTIKDKNIIAAFKKVPRHLFVPALFEHRAYKNTPLPIGHGQTISQPSLVAKMTSLLELTGDEKVLEIGTGSGYQAAILSQLAKKVFSVERIPVLAKKAQKILQTLGYNNVEVHEANGTKGLPNKAPFDAIIVTASSPQIPQPLVDQLKENGRIVIPVTVGSTEKIQLGVKKDNELRITDHQNVRFVPLVGEHGWND